MKTPPNVPEIRVEARIRNNVLWHQIFDRYSSVAEFCRQHPGMQQTQVGALLNGCLNPRSPKKGEYRKVCLELARIFGLHPDDLFPSRFYELEKTKMAAEIPFAALPSADREVLFLPDTTMDAVVRAELQRSVGTALGQLSTREEKVLRLRFGLNGEDEHTREEIGKILGVTRERARQIELRALNRLRHPLRSNALRTFHED